MVQPKVLLTKCILSFALLLNPPMNILKGCSNSRLSPESPNTAAVDPRHLKVEVAN